MSNRDYEDRRDGEASRKREHSSGGGGDEPPRREPYRGPRSMEREIIKIPHARAGAVIGRGGSKVAELQEQSNCLIKIDSFEDHGERVVLIEGRTERERQHAKDLIDQIVKGDGGGYRRQEGSYGRDRGDERYGGYGDRRQESNDGRDRSGIRSDGYGDRDGARGYGSGQEQRIEFPDEYCGLVIGRGGSKIKEIQEKAGCRISVQRGDWNTSAVAVFHGDDTVKKTVQEMIDAALEESPQYRVKKAMENPPPPQPEPVHEEFDWGKAIEESEKASRERWEKKIPVKKDFYQESDAIKAMTPEEVASFRASKNDIRVTNADGSDAVETAPKPIASFEDAFGPYPEIMEEIKKQGFEKPSPIQCQAWPALLSGKDMIGIAQTGTGKTLAFLLPALIHIDSQPIPRNERVGPSALIIAPTRELAQQIEGEVKKYTYKGIKSACVYGGTARRGQSEELMRAGIEIIIATPGRLCDLIFTDRSETKLDITNVSYMVLDEADRMLDLGFEPDIRKVFINIRPDKQMIMTSATWPEEVRRLATTYMKDPVMVYIGTLDLRACSQIHQRIQVVEEYEKEKLLQDFLGTLEVTDKAIVFFGRKATVDDVGSNMVLKGFDLHVLHGKHSQEARENSLQDFREGTVRLLFATDLASRGIDVIDVTHVFNYDFPRDIEEYVHRVGRTGRAGRLGMAITLMTRDDWRHAKPLMKILVDAAQRVPPEVEDMADRHAAMLERRGAEGGRGRGRGRGGGRRRYRDAGADGAWF